MSRVGSSRGAASALAPLLWTALVAPLGSAQGPPLTTRLAPLPAGRVQLTITNNSQQPITAFAIYTVFGPQARSIRIVDSLINRGFDREVMPGDTQRFVFGGVVRLGVAVPPQKITLEAAVFADGSTFGDPQWIQAITRNRKTVYQNYATALRELQSARASKQTRGQIVGRFTALKEEALHCGGSGCDGAIGHYLTGNAAIPFQYVIANLAYPNMGGGRRAPLNTITQILISQIQVVMLRMRQARPPVTTP